MFFLLSLAIETRACRCARCWFSCVSINLNRMRKILFMLGCLLFVNVGVFVSAQNLQVQEAELESEQDSTVDVISWFKKKDTAEYWIYENEWRIGEDTVKKYGVASKVRLVVTDSTPKGYKMEYTFLAFAGDTVDGSFQSRFINKLIAMMGDRVVGTVVRFEINEVGKITKITNLKQLSKQVKAQFKEATKLLAEQPEIQRTIAEVPEFVKLFKYISFEQLLKGYVEELELLFTFHGTSYYIGEFHSHEDASGAQYENNRCTVISSEPESGFYSIENRVENIIPQSTVKDLVGATVKLFVNDSISENFDREFDKAVTVDAIYEEYLKIDYFPTGWPYALVNRKSSLIGGHGKIQQTRMELDYISE